MNKLFVIGDFCFRLIYPESIVPPDNFMLFECSDGAVQYTYELELCEQFPLPEGIQVAAYPDLAVFCSNNLEIRYIGAKGAYGYYACYRETDSCNAKVYIALTGIEGLNVDPVFASLLALERRLINRNGLILHCAYLQYQEQAVLFSAPSETGKTTQANLWQKYRGSRTINGDRSLLQLTDDGWIARGWPVCGTSDVCSNEDYPVRAIVMLSQGKSNTVTKLTSLQAFSQIYSQITINSWNREVQQRSIDLIEQLIMAVPVYHLSCTISEQAVECLEQVLYP